MFKECFWTFFFGEENDRNGGKLSNSHAAALIVILLASAYRDAGFCCSPARWKTFNAE